MTHAQQLITKLIMAVREDERAISNGDDSENTIDLVADILKELGYLPGEVEDILDDSI